MVSTRGGARTGADDQAETELRLRKKPVRKTAATTKTAKATPATKTTRSKQTEPQREDEEADELQGDETVEAPKTIRKGRARKDDVITTTAAAQSKPAAATRARRPATTTTVTRKTAATRTAKSSKAVAATPDLPPPAQPKPARATRATASTRATAAKERAPPLSPKKITQVSKAPTRTTKTANSRATTAKKDEKAAPKGRPAAQRRGASDENADVPMLRPSTTKKQGDDPEFKQTSKGEPAVEKSTARDIPEPEMIEVDNETPMSTRPTTPADSTRLELDDEEQEMEDVKSDDGGEVEGSSDELWGPKTPMKRLSPRERSNYTSVQQGRHAEDIPLKTPARRFLVLGAQGGTPQTQKPYCKPSLPMSEVRPTTVARARDRAMVFPKLQPLTLPLALEEADETADDESAYVSVDGEQTVTNEEQHDILENPGHVSEEYGESDRPQKHKDDLSVVSHDDHVFNHEECEDLPSNDEGHSATDLDAGERKVVVIPFQMKKLSISDITGEAEDETDLVEADDPDETIVMEDEDMEDRMDSQVDVSLGSEQSVLVRHDPATEADESFTCDESMEEVHLPMTTPKPETIVWGNLREDVTIPFNFDSVLSPSRTSDLGELDRLPNLACCGSGESQPTSEAVACAAEEEGALDLDVDMTLANPQFQRQSFGDVRLSVDATVNLSDFLDMSSLAEQPSQTSPPHANVVDGNGDEDETEVELGDDDNDKNNEGEREQTSMAMSPQHTGTPFQLPSTPVHESLPSLPNVLQLEPQDMPDPITPHYAMPTIAFRRKSLPAIVYHTPMKSGIRPKTSDGASIPRIANPFAYVPVARDVSRQGMTPTHRRLSTAQPFGGVSRPQTPAAGTPARTISQKTPRTSGRGNINQTPRMSSRLSVRPTPKERFPGLPSQQTYDELASTPTVKTLRSSMLSAAKSSANERFPALPPADKYEDLVKTPVSGSTSKAKCATPPAEQLSTSPIGQDTSMVQQEERYPGLPHRRTYEEHARTAMPASRFRTPSQSPAKRPATLQRPASLRKLALKAATPSGSRTPIKTPLRAPAMTPGQVPLTPHPGAPLRGVNAYVDVFLNDGSSVNSTYIAVLHSLGAKTTRTFNDRVTHVIFKEGSPATLQRLRLHNKQVIDSAKGKAIFCVNGRWVNDSNSEGARMDETDEAYAVDIEDQRASKRRRKSMEPTSLLNIGGNVVRDTGRKTSLGRSSLSRALMAGSPCVESPSMAMSIDAADKENIGDISFGDMSPATPAYLADPDSLVQQTAPMNRVRKLDFDAQEQAKNRRLTFWDGGEF